MLALFRSSEPRQTSEAAYAFNGFIFLSLYLDLFSQSSVKLLRQKNNIKKLQISWSVFYQHNMRLMNILALLMTVTTLFWLTCLPAKTSLQEWQTVWDISLDSFSFYQASIRHIYRTNKFIIDGLDSLKDPPDYCAREKWLVLLWKQKKN